MRRAFSRGYSEWFFFSLVSLFLLQCSKDFSHSPKLKKDGDEIVLISELVPSQSRVPIGGAQVEIQARLSTHRNRPVAGEAIHFTTTLGNITPVDTTDQDGLASAILTSGNSVGEAAVTARYKNESSRSVMVYFDSTYTETMKINLSSTSVLADGMDSLTVIIFLTNDQGKPATQAIVQCTATAGRFSTSFVTTDSLGQAKNLFVANPSESDSLAILRFSAFGIANQATVQMRGVEFRLDASPRFLIANGESKAEISAILKESTRKVAIPGARVVFATDRGTIPWSGTTGMDGVARVELTAGTAVGPAQVVGFYGTGFSDTVTVDFIRSEPAQMYVTVNPKVLPADNSSSARIQVRVLDLNNDPVPDGTAVRFAISRGSGSIEPLKLTSNGMVQNQLIASNHPDTTVVTIQTGGLQDSVEVVYSVGEAAFVEVSADSVSIPADGITTTTVRARVLDKAGNAVRDGTSVKFETSIGNIPSEAVTVNGEAMVQFSSNQTGIAVIRASVGQIFDEITVNLRPGKPASILLNFDPKSLGVRDSGRNQSVRIIAEVRDSKNNAVIDGTLVKFSIYASPGGGESLSSDEPVPTVNGKAEVSLTSGIRSGTVRVQAEVVDSSFRPLLPSVQAVSTEIIIFAGPPFIEDINDRSTSHLSVGTSPMNILGWQVVNNTATVTAVVGDKYNNPVPEGTAVYFTTSGGVISTHTGYTDAEGIATVIIHSAQPYPTIDRFYHTFFDPNRNHPNFSLPSEVIPGPIPDFEFSKVLNSEGDFVENDGIVRILATSEGVDASGNKATVWGVTGLVFSGLIHTFAVDVSPTQLSPGESAHITIQIYDVNGNPIVPGSVLTADASAGALSWTNLETSDPGTTLYHLYLTNNLDPNNPDAKETSTQVTVKVTSENGNDVRSTSSILLKLE